MEAILRATILSALLLSSGAANANERAVREHVERYFLEFNQSKPALYLAETFLSSPLTLVFSTGVEVKGSNSEVAGWLSDIQSTLATNGWVRSELLESRVCVPGESIAVFSAKFARVMSETRTMHGVTYVLFKSDRWRIVSALFTSPGVFLHCDET